MPAVFSKKEFAIVSNLWLISRTNSMLSRVVHNIYYIVPEENFMPIYVQQERICSC